MEQLYTRWGRELNKEMPLAEYPRPQMVRDSFICLNGIWEYAIYPTGRTFEGYEGDIVVPFSPECLLSGVGRSVTPEDTLYYRKKFNFTKTGDRVLLHFGAVDYKCEVSVNGTCFGTHTGGYFPFEIDITKALKEGENEITLKVTDPSEQGSQASGKQTSKRGNIWYTPQSGIWQTVWLEEVPENYIKSLKITPDIDSDTLKVEIEAVGNIGEVTVTALDGEKVLCSAATTAGSAVLKIADYEKWTPENPRLYDLVIKSASDEVKSYFGMRKFGIGKDKDGFTRLMLNNEPYFQNGLLDQGYWSDGQLTPPTDEAMVYDIVKMKELGFNMLRKHIKVEPARWYYYCDKYGMLVWQDMISGGQKLNTFYVGVIPNIHSFLNPMIYLSKKDNNYKLQQREKLEWRQQFEAEYEEMIDCLYNVPSICCWVPFNEAWGQFDAKRIGEWTKKKDPTRFCDHASGWYDQKGPDFRSVHKYIMPVILPKYDNRPIVLSEYGGYSSKIEGHVWNWEKSFGYQMYADKDKLTEAYRKLHEKQIIPNIKNGLSATVYTQVSDVEFEVNGMLTYDREIVKLHEDVVKEINEKLKY